VAAGQDRPPIAALNAALTRLRTTLAQLTGAGAHHQALPLLRRRTAVGAVDWGRGGEQFNALVVAAGEPGIRGRVRAHRHHRGWGAAAAAARASLDLRRGVDATRQI